MRYKPISMFVSVILAALALLVPPAGTARAETVPQKISRTGKFTAGTRTESIPFGFINDKKEWVGFSVDLIKQIHRRLERNFARKIKLELKAVNPENRIQMVADGKVDIECGSTTYTRSRDETVDFSINFFFSSAQLLIKADGPIKAGKDIPGKPIGVARGTTTERHVRTKLPQNQVVLVEDHSEGFEALQQGKVDAYASDGILLAGLAVKSGKPDAYKIVGAFSFEPYSCILPENDSKWRDLVNHTLMEMIEDGTYFELYDKWFGQNGVVPYKMPPEAKFLTLMQVMPR
ncbi:MAG: transporter substrate-binding domain-containing protein [Candidatus Methylomirabilales bacterium]